MGQEAATNEIAQPALATLSATITGNPVSVPTRPSPGSLETTPVPDRPPTYEHYRPPRTTAEGGATMLLSGVLAAGAVVVLLLAVYTKLADVRTFGQIANLLTLAVALLLLATYVLVWEITMRLIARTEE